MLKNINVKCMYFIKFSYILTVFCYVMLSFYLFLFLYFLFLFSFFFLFSFYLLPFSLFFPSSPSFSPFFLSFFSFRVRGGEGNFPPFPLRTPLIYSRQQAFSCASSQKISKSPFFTFAPISFSFLLLIQEI